MGMTLLHQMRILFWIRVARVCGPQDLLKMPAHLWVWLQTEELMSGGAVFRCQLLADSIACAGAQTCLILQMKQRTLSLALFAELLRNFRLTSEGFCS
jgi:hypothetical protein